MAKPPIRIKRSAVPGAIPTTAQLALGELAINTADGKVFLKKNDGAESIIEVGGGAGGYTAPALLALYDKTNSGVADSFDGTETRFQLRNTSGNTVAVTSALNLAISVNGVIQKPNIGTPTPPFEGFYITANTSQGFDIVFDTAPPTGSDFFGVLSGTFTAVSGTSGIKALDDISAGFNGTATAFTLQYNGSNFAPQFPDSVVVSVGGVLQVPTDAYTISGSTITFTSAPPSGVSFYALSFEIGNAGSFDLVDSVTSTSTTDAATPNSVKTAYDLAAAALEPGDIGVTVQAYDADTAKLDVTQTFTAAQTFSNNVTLNGQADLRFADANSSNWVAFQAPATVSTNITWTLPSADGIAGQTLSTDGLGNLSWITSESFSRFKAYFYSGF